MMGGFLPPAERRSGVLLGFYAALSLLLLIAGERIPATSLRAVGAWAFAPLDRAVLSVGRVSSAWRENQRLHQRITELELETTHLRSAAVENQALRRQLALPTWSGVPVKPIEILAISGEPVPVAAVLSAGRRQGVETGDAVLTDEGLLGRVTEVYPTLSRAALITDPIAAVACEVETTGVLAVLRSDNTSGPRLTLTGIPVNDTVRVGQRVLTSGLSRRYPRGLPVGVISRIGRDPNGLTQKVEVTPTARFSRLRYGFVMAGPRPLAGLP
jgi:rod shape-determining protein MreC